MTGEASAKADPEDTPGSAGPPRWWRYLTVTLLVLAVAVTAGYLLSSWLVNADVGGKRDLGMAIAAAYASVLGVYVSVALAGLNFLVAVTGMLARLRSGVAWLATVVALVPVGWLIVSG